MKILLLTPNFPYPLTEGGKIAQYSIIDSLRKSAAVVLVVTVYSKAQEENADHLQKIWPDVTFRKIQFFQQEEKSKAGKKIKIFLRNMFLKLYKSKLITSFKEQKNQVVYETNSPYLINLFGIKQRNLVNQVSAIIEEEKPDIVQVELLDYIDLALIIPHHIKKIFVHQELRFRRLLFFFKAGNFPITAYDYYIIEKIKKEEIAFLKLYDGVFVFSEEDRNDLVREGLHENIYVAPFSVLAKYFVPITNENVEIDKLVFVGSESHSPNADAIEWYVNTIAAEMNKVKKIPLHITGNWSEGTKNKYRDNPHVYFAGFVEDLVDYCRHSIMLVPVRMGSGIRTKILYAMAQGVPIISTTIGYEGIRLKNRESILIADTPAAFAKAFKLILENKELTLSLITSAQKAADTYYSQEAAVALRMKYFGEILNKKVNA